MLKIIITRGKWKGGWKRITIYKEGDYWLRLWTDLLTFEARIIALAVVLVVIHSFSARRWRCLAFFALFGANRVSRSSNASLNFSAICNSLGIEADAGSTLGVNPVTAHVRGSMSFTTGSSIVIFGSASLGTSSPLKPSRDGLGFGMMRGHSTTKLSNESLSIFGCRQWIWRVRIEVYGESKLCMLTIRKALYSAHKSLFDGQEMSYSPHKLQNHQET